MRKRNKQICIRLTDDERDRIADKAEKSNLSMQEYIINCALNKKITVVNSHEDLAKMRAEIKRIGNNINQIAKKANTFGLNSEDIKTLLERQSVLLQIITKLYHSFNQKRR